MTKYEIFAIISDDVSDIGKNVITIDFFDNDKKFKSIDMEFWIEG